VRTSRSTRGKRSVRDAVVPVRAPYRLDLTAVVLRRLSTNAVDVFDGTVYRRLLGEPSAPTLFSARQTASDALTVTLDGPEADRFDSEILARRLLGTDVDLRAFYAGAKAVPWLHALARGARGVKPPRYPSLWETACNAIVYQQISIHAAGAILRRAIERYARPLERDGVRLFPFPPIETLLNAAPADLRALGLSVHKINALLAVGRAIATNALDEAALDVLPTPQMLDALVAHKGIGPWTAAVIALRGFGRLDVFPMKDSGATALLRKLSGDPDAQAEPILAALSPQQGMLYYHLLLGRLHATGEVALTRSPSSAAR
jgi:DNA-3-methyladenine glycosylase II